MAVSVLCVGIVMKNRKQKECLLAFGAMAVMPITVAAGVLASILLRPVFVERYMLPTLACFWLGFAFLLSKFGKRQYLFTAISVLFLGIGIMQYSSNITIVLENRERMEAAEELFSSMGSNDIIVHTSLNTEIPVAYYCGDSLQYLIEESSTLKIDQIVFDNVANTITPDDINNLITEGKKVWCFVYPDITIMDEEWKQLVNEGRHLGEYVLDWCQFYVYRLN